MTLLHPGKAATEIRSTLSRREHSVCTLSTGSSESLVQRRQRRTACSVAAPDREIKPVAFAPITPAARATMFQDEAPEQVGLLALEVQGTIPDWLSGDFYRTGPGMFAGMKHYFDGLAMLVHFQFTAAGAPEGSPSRVTWQQRFLDTTDYRAWREAGTPQFPAFLFNPGFLRSAMLATKEMAGLGLGVTDNAAVTIYPSDVVRTEAVAFTESLNGAIRVDRGTLATKGAVAKPPKSLAPGLLHSAHPRRLPDGTSINVNLNVPFGEIRVMKLRIGEDGGASKVLYNLPVSNGRRRNSWMHDLAVTDRHIALVEQPLYLSVKAQMGFESEIPAFDWCPEDGTTVRILSTDGSGPTRPPIHMPPWFSFHFINVCEVQHPKLGTCVVIDAAVGSSPQAIVDLKLDRMMDAAGDIAPLLLKRMYFPVTGDGEPMVEDLVVDHASYGEFLEFPCVNPLYERNSSYRYCFGGTIRRPSPQMNQVSKVDLHERRVVAQWCEPGGGPVSEGRMVPRPGGDDEDDGVFVQPAVDSSGNSFVVVLDAKDLKELARAYTPKPFTLGFHSAFMPLVEGS